MDTPNHLIQHLLNQQALCLLPVFIFRSWYSEPCTFFPFHQVPFWVTLRSFWAGLFFMLWLFLHSNFPTFWINKIYLYISIYAKEKLEAYKSLDAYYFSPNPCGCTCAWKSCFTPISYAGFISNQTFGFPVGLLASLVWGPTPVPPHIPSFIPSVAFNPRLLIHIWAR